jgi:HSP20 family protein
MRLTQWTPGRDFTQLQDRINRLFSDTYPRGSGGGDEGLMNQGTWIPPVDIYQNENHEIVLKAELPDMQRDDIQVTVDGNTLTIKGEKKLKEDVKEDQIQRMERVYGTFTRSFTLPPNVDTSKLAAEYKDGVLTVRIPLREEAKPRQIEVRTAA